MEEQITISQLITKLQEIQKELGDLPVDFDWGADYSPLMLSEIEGTAFMQSSILLSFGAD